MSELLESIDPFISLKDEILLNEVLGECSMAIQMGDDFILFCILEHKRKKILFLETYQFSGESDMVIISEYAQKIIQKNDLLRSSFKNVIISYVNKKSTLIPIPLYSEEHKIDYFKINHVLENGMSIHTDKIQILGAINIYAVQEVVENNMHKLFSSARINHFSSGLIESFLLKYKNSTKKIVVVHVQLSSFEILVINGKNLSFYNSFAIKTPEDFVYYILFVFEQLKLNPDSIDLVLCGQIIRNSELFLLLNQYVRNIRFEERDKAFDYSYVFEEIPQHFYYNLFNQFKCVL